VFADRDAVVDAFGRWLWRAAHAGGQPTLVANVADAGVADVVARLAGWPGQIVTMGLDQPADISARAAIEDGQTNLVVSRPGQADRTFVVGLAGLHNAYNALAIVGAAQVLGVDDDALAGSLVEFSGVGRRMELKGDVGGVVVLDDYGHHPTAIARTLEAVRQRYPGRRVWAVYEPLTFHRTALMLDQFADALAAADAVAIADIWAGRDPDTTITSSSALAEAVSGRGRVQAEAPGSVEATADYLAGNGKEGDVVLVMGGGRSYAIAVRLVELLKSAAR